MDEKTPEQLFNEMMEQQQKMQQAMNTPLQGQQTSSLVGGGPGQLSPDEQRILNELKSQPAPTTQPITVNPTQSQCPQCHLFHPPLPPGKKCPNAPIEVAGISDEEVNQIVVKVKDILASQLEQKGIKDVKKFTNEMILTLMKFCEGYKE
jgi:hypothetical protein